MIKKFKIFEKHIDGLSPLLMIDKSENKPYDQITYLNCFSSQLTSLDGIENLVNLEKLSCWNNKLTSLKGIENLVNLKYLQSHNNQLTSLEEIENLVNLDYLDCSNNQLTSLKGIENLVNLRTLYCSNNQLTNIDLEGIEDLYNIGMEGMGLFDNLKKLKYLDIRNNNLSKKYKDYLKKKFKNINFLV